ncbi:MAG: hypothetical protein HUU15_02085 [Candidatus Brocadiae bacterium]|nr:hypothetical protein [Candidatus Brocadiia bacterium]
MTGAKRRLSSLRAVTEAEVALRIGGGGTVTLVFATAVASDLVILATEGGSSPTALGAFLLGAGDFAAARAAWKGSPRSAELEQLAGAWETAAIEADAQKALVELRAAAGAADWKKVKLFLDRAGKFVETAAWKAAESEIADWREFSRPKLEPGFAVQPKKTKEGLEWSYDFSTEEQLRDWRAVGTEDFAGLPAFGVKMEKGGLRVSNAGMVFRAPLTGECRIRGEVTILRKIDYPIVGADLRGHGWVMVNDEDSIIRLPRDRNGPWLADMREAAIGRPVPFEYRVDEKKLTVTWDGGAPREEVLTAPAHTSHPSLWAAGETEVIWSKIVVTGTLAPEAAQELQAADAAFARVGADSPLGGALLLSDGASLGLLKKEGGGTWKPSEGVLSGVSADAESPATLRFPRPVRNFRLSFRYRVLSGRHASVTVRAGAGWTVFLLPAATPEWQSAEITAVERHLVCRMGTGLLVKPVEGGDPVEAGEILFQARATTMELDDVALRAVEKVAAEPAWAEVYSFLRPGKIQGLRVPDPAGWKAGDDGSLTGRGEIGIPSTARNFMVYVFFYSEAGRETSLRIRLGDAVLDEGPNLYANHRLVLRVVGADATAVLDGLPIPGVFAARVGTDPLRLKFESGPVAIRSISIRETP